MACVGVICDLTFIAIYSNPPWFTRKTRSVLYVTRVVVTINGARIVTLATVETSIITTCINFKNELHKNLKIKNKTTLHVSKIVYDVI